MLSRELLSLSASLSTASSMPVIGGLAGAPALGEQNTNKVSQMKFSRKLVKKRDQLLR